MAARCPRAEEEAGALLAIEPQGRFRWASGAPVLSVLRKRRRLASAAAALAAYRSAILVSASRTIAVGATAAMPPQQEISSAWLAPEAQRDPELMDLWHYR
jgi:hypothetical protein